jgi:hypothetical protein
MRKMRCGVPVVFIRGPVPGDLFHQKVLLQILFVSGVMTVTTAEAIAKKQDAEFLCQGCHIYLSIKKKKREPYIIMKCRVYV